MSFFEEVNSMNSHCSRKHLLKNFPNKRHVIFIVLSDAEQYLIPFINCYWKINNYGCYLTPVPFFFHV